MMNNNGKKTMGRRKIEIKKIEKKTSLQVTFSKRRMGIFRKASELSVLCGSEIAILVQSPASKVYAFGSPSVEAVLRRFGGGIRNFSPELSIPGPDSRIEYAEAVRKLENEKMRVMENWWDEPIEGMELQELEEYLEALEGLRGNVSHRLEEIEKQKFAAVSSNSSTFLTSEGYQDNGFLMEFNNQPVNEWENTDEDLDQAIEEALAQMERESAYDHPWF